MGKKNATVKRGGGWKIQMVMIWISQFLSIMGFSFSLSFAPYFIQQDLGITRSGELQLWIALFSSATAMTMAVAAPLWGILADRYGKRIMLLRANLAGALCMSLMGGVQRPGMLIALRLFQGAFTGTMTAAQAFLSSKMPSRRRGLAMGGLSAAVYSGTMAGAFLGGWVAHAFGYRRAFAISGGLLLAAALFVWFGTTEGAAVDAEDSEKNEDDALADAAGTLVPAGNHPAKALPEEAAKESARMPRIRGGWRWLSGAMGGVLVAVGAVSLARQFDISFLPLLVQDIHGQLDRTVALWSGSLNACGSVAGLLAGFLAGSMADRVRPICILMWGALATAIFSGGQMFVHSFGVLFPVRFATIFFAGMLEPALNAWLAKRVPEEHQGVIFGLASTARSVGWSVGPLLAGGVAMWHLRAVFGVSGAAYLLLGVIFAVIMRRRRESTT